MMVVRALLTACEQAIEIQSQYANKAYDTWVAEASKLSEMYVGMARDAYKPVEQAVAKRAPKGCFGLLISKKDPGGLDLPGLFVGVLLFTGRSADSRSQWRTPRVCVPHPRCPLVARSRQSQWAR
jgi:hypothetical protein